MTEVVHCNDVDALKITCCDLFRAFPQESEQYVPGLLRWKGVLSERQVREVLDILRDQLTPEDFDAAVEVLKTLSNLNAGLLDHLKDSYSHHIFTNLDLLLNRDLSVKEIFCLLLWGKDVFFSSDSQHFFRAYDPLLLTGWFQRATEKLLPKLQDDISKTLQNILNYDEELGHNGDSMDEETVIRVHLDVTQAFLRHYFKEEGEKIQVLTEAIKKQCASLPETDEGKEIQKIFVNVSYDCVSRVYLDCLMKSKFRRLERRWGNVGKRISKDVLSLHNTFTELNGTDDQRNHLLQRLSEVLLCSDVEAMKITCCNLFRDFPQDSERYVPGLLRWKGMLSERQMREVLGLSRDLGLELKPRRGTCQPLKGLFCFL
ncbi:hypothetical protein G5714_013208 [Onychostoma macrolepis]|uniref:Uncharacterized protein n=1 Tax=Onychostoma macrolepis TaxID=369639 RepID=A0A7J6CEL6_9TELE|nr:hypothetical protein G5714_013208 [Onychostoma macrolepis]